MDPLRIAGRLSELIDARLSDLEPVADGDFFANAIAERTNVRDFYHCRQA